MINPISIKSIHCLVDEKYDCLYHNFLSSIKDSKIEVVKHEIKISHDEVSEKSYEGMLPWETNQFKFAMRNKIQEVIKSLKENKGAVIWSDIDIVFLKPMSKICENLTRTINYCDLAVSPEWEKNINTGFFVARCNRISIDFFEKLLHIIVEKNETEQPLANNLLGARERQGINKFPIRWRRLSEAYWNMTLNTPLSESSFFIHANWPGGFEKYTKEKLNGDYVQKKKQMIDFFLNSLK